jgi:tRNA (guanine10-N2)-dimethyltransferase
MKHIFLLSKENLELSKEEVLSLEKKEYILDDNLLILDSDNIDFLSKRLAYTKKILRLLFLCKEKELKENLENYDWQKVYKKSFSLKIEGKTDHKEADLAGYIWNKVKNPKVDLEKPSTPIYLFFTSKKVYCCLLEKEIKQDYNKRKAHLRPENHPTSLNPRLAKALVNLTGIKKGTLVDPFCGSGGILIEAGLMDLKTIGYDIDQIMLNRARINLENYKIKDFRLIKKDATKLNKKIQYLVTDLPYGRNTKQKDLENIYKPFISNLKKILTKRAVICFPLFEKKNINYKKLIKDNKLKIKKEFEYYLHKSLSKKIFVLDKY